MSSGFKDGNKGRIVVNDKEILEKAKRGFNVAALAGQNHEIIAIKSYDTYGDSNASKRMVEDFATLPVGTVIVAVVKDEGSRKLTKAAKDIFISMGSKEVT